MATLGVDPLQCSVLPPLEASFSSPAVLSTPFLNLARKGCQIANYHGEQGKFLGLEVEGFWGVKIARFARVSGTPWHKEAFGPTGSASGGGPRDVALPETSASQMHPDSKLTNHGKTGETVPRSKRRCVLERKQPYSGDEWCSGPESEDDDKSLGSSHNCHVAESAMSAGAQLGPGSNPLPALSESNTPGAPHSAAPSLRSDAGGKQGLQLVYVFTTHLANTAAEAVLQGQADSILGYHQQHVPRAKLDQPTPLPKMPGAVEPLPLHLSPANTPQGPPALPPSSQAQGQQVGGAPLGLGQGPISSSNALPPEGPPEEACQDLTPNSVGNGSNSSSSVAPSSTHPSTPTTLSSLQASTAEGLLGEVASTGPPAAGNGPRNPLNTEGLSKEQLEHRERSLQTLRDIERLLLRGSEAEPFLKGGAGPGEGAILPPQATAPQPPQGALSGTGVKKYEEPLQSMISQTQSLGGPGLEQEGPLPPGVDLGQPMNMVLQRLGQDSLTPEQVAWRKLQEEYYEEKRRKEEQAGLHGGRPLQEVMLAQPLGGVMLRGPPPPYHSRSGEQWLLRGAPLDIQEQLRPTFPGPRGFPGGHVQRGFATMPSLPLESLGPVGGGPRPVQPGLPWGEDLPLRGPGHFAPGGLSYPPGQGEAERFLPSRAREDLLRHPLLEKRPGSLGLEMERVLPTHRQVEPGMFAGEGLGLEFGGGRALMSPPPPLQEVEPSALATPTNLNMNVNMNMNLSVQMTPQQQQQMLLTQKARGPELMSPEEMARGRAPNGTGAIMGAPPKMLMGSPFPGQGQQQNFSGQGPYPPVPQEMGGTPDMFGPEQGGLAGTPRLTHVPLPPSTSASATNMHAAPIRGLGRRPSDLALNMGQMNSPSVGRLKSPTLSQAHSPLGTSPSANLKSPQTPSALVSLPATAASSGPLKSPQMLGSVLNVRSPTSSPGHLKSPSMAVSSPGWAPSPKASLASPGKPALGMGNSAPLGHLEQGAVPSGSRSSSSAPPGNTSGPLNPNLPFPSSPDPPPSQNPLSLMMSQMSKYAMPSSTPLYHNAIKTIATSDDELLPDRPLLPPGAMSGMGGNQPNPMHVNSVGPAPVPSPMGLNLAGQQLLSQEVAAPPMSSPSPLGTGLPMHTSAPVQNPMMPPGPPDALGQPCGPSGQLVFAPRLQQPPTNGGGIPMAPGGAAGPGLQQPPPPQQHHYPPGLGVPPEELPPQQVPPQQRLAGRLPESYPSVLPGVASVLSDPELSDVIRPTPTGIPEFDLSRIIPSEKPSSTLQYFPKGEGQGVKALPPSNLHLASLQNMMVEQGPARPGPQAMPRGMALCHPGQMPVLGRTGLPPQQSLVGNSLPQGLVLPQQSLLAQQNFLLMQAKQRSISVSGEMYGQPAGHLISPQGSLMGPPSQQNLMVSMRQRSVSLDGQMSYGPGAGGMANLPF
ncbi:B-cell CLL/lymphoma 9-like protein isoform X3 [Pituophis catenifer annectens]|uniref:B-cell CLL/lymphoma 9-like protein isoform X3 n=1 Tax=Pituophis catenifer annectens TaxID=94852 RepID=UPI003993C1A1